MSNVSQNARDVIRYYNKTESRWGYRLILGGTRHFGYYDPGVSKWSFQKAMRRMEDELAVALSLKAGSSVFDAGCGVGEVAVALATRHHLRVTGMDLLPQNIDEAKRRAARAGVSDLCTFTVGDYSQLVPIPGQFDGVFTMETLVHLPDPASTLKVFLEMLKPGGKVALFEYEKQDDSALDSKAAQAIRRVNAEAAMPGFDQFVYGALEQMLINSGFVGVERADLTEKMLPMLTAFNQMATVPFAILEFVGLGRKIPNAMSAVKMHKAMGFWRYSRFTASAPVCELQHDTVDA